MSEELESKLAAIQGLAGRVAMARVKDGVATVMLDATGLSAEERAGLERQVRAAHIAATGGTATRVAMTAEKLQRTIIAIGSGKGGVGKSTVSANVAVALARMGKKVGLLDADIYGPSMPLMMGLFGGKPTSDDGKRVRPLDAYGVRVISIGFFVDPDQAMI